MTKVYVSAMALAGLFAGLAASMTVLGLQQSVTDQVVGSVGFDAITVALLGRATPLGTVLAGLLFGAFRAGGVVMGTDTNTPSDIINVIEPVMVLFIAAPSLIRGLFRLRASRGGSVGQLARGWNG